MSVLTAKNEYRRRLRRARLSLPPAQRRRAEQSANRLLKRFIKRGQRIGVYWPVGSEMRLQEFVRTVRQRGACAYLPYIPPQGKRLWFTPYPTRNDSKRQAQTVHRIPQFDGARIRAERLHLLILPLLGIDRNGCRLGQGGGYYDATLAAAKRSRLPKLVGVGFACQETAEALPAEAHDQRLNYFVCERGIRRFQAACTLSAPLGASQRDTNN